MSEKPKSDITVSQVYGFLTSLMVYSEQVRWTRLNTFLVVASIFLAAWATVFAGTNDFQYKQYLLFALCIPGTVLGILWAGLGWRSSQYMDDFHDSARKMEEDFPSSLPKPMHISEKRRKDVRKGMARFTSSKCLVTVVPLLFTMLFLALGLASFKLEKEIVIKSKDNINSSIIKQGENAAPNTSIQRTR